VGGVVLGLPRWKVNVSEPVLETASLASEYNHYEAAVIATFRLPMMLLVHQDVAKRGIFGYGSGPWFTVIPNEAQPSWIESAEFSSAFEAWRVQVEARHDLFLGYSSKAKGLARNVKNFLTGILQLRVHDWEQDFAPGASILVALERAADLCSGGVFLFTMDDDFAPGSAGKPHQETMSSSRLATLLKRRGRTVCSLFARKGRKYRRT
jgi:hypothetical protein